MAVRLRGAVVAAVVDRLRQQLGSDRFALLASRCAPESASLLERRSLISEWVSGDAWFAVHETLVRELLAGDHGELARMSRAMCLGRFSPLQRTLFRYLPLQWVVHMTLARWMHEGTEGIAVGTARGAPYNARKQLFVDYDMQQKASVYVHVVRGYVEALAEASAARNPVVSIAEILPSKLGFSYRFAVVYD